MLWMLWISGSSASEMENRLAGWKRELLRAHGLIAGLFARSEARGRSLAYMRGLLNGCERKNGWQMAEWMGEASPYAMQHLLDRASWDARGQRLPEMEKRISLSSRTLLWFNCTTRIRRFSRG